MLTTLFLFVLFYLTLVRAKKSFQTHFHFEQLLVLTERLREWEGNGANFIKVLLFERVTKGIHSTQYKMPKQEVSFTIFLLLSLILLHPLTGPPIGKTENRNKRFALIGI